MDFNLERIINHRISMLSLLMKRQVLKIIADNRLDVTPEQWVVLFYLWQEDGLSIGEIAQRANKDFANVTRIVDKLIKMEYVTKKKSALDGRSFQVYIQPKADHIKDSIQNCWKQASDVALKNISEAEQAQLDGILAKIEHNISNDLK
ncbi:MarR family winged helix-turn-helix transcriptional regulator [Saccharicrinis sp. FJH54]|uniref:MarR family winged helix-turn-helix transcriptional regulator n=1 Tax=Saccharicrinis sp. FJH54 TaxID=3344665 RepID=UPI0035D3F32A